MSYLNFSISRPLYGMKKSVRSSTLKTGDRFLIEGKQSLFFKTDIEQKNGYYLCSNELGQTLWLEGNLKVTRINGISFTFNEISKYFTRIFLESKENKEV